MRAILAPLLAGIGCLTLASVPSEMIAAATVSKPYDVRHLPAKGPARVASLGHRTFVSDLYWLSTVQYIGEPRTERRGWDMLFPLADLVTDLDPRHGYAYQTAGIVLSAVGRLGESDAILTKGMEKGPPYWTFPYYLAFNYWFYRGDYVMGAKYAEIAARRPGASTNISRLALSLASKSGTPEQAITLLEELRATVKDKISAERLDEQLNLARLERDAQRLEQAAARLEKHRGWPIASLQDLVLAGMVREIPPDPFGGHYVWDSNERRVHSSVNPFRFGRREGRHRPRFEYDIPETKTERMLR